MRNKTVSDINIIKLEKKKVYCKKIKTSKLLFLSNLIEFTIKSPVVYFEKFEVAKIHSIDTENLEFYRYSSHFSSVKNICIPNKDNKLTFILKNINFYLKTQQLKVRLDVDMLNQIICKLFEEYKNMYSRNFEMWEIEKIYSELLLNQKLLLKTNNLKSLSALHAELSFMHRIINMIKISKITNIGEKWLYLPVEFDFRGRFYYSSSISPTFNKEFRYCIFYGNYSIEEIITPQKHFFTEKIEKEIITYGKLIEDSNLFTNFQNKEKNVKNAIVGIILSLGKTRLLKEKINIEEFLTEGVNLYMKFKDNIATRKYFKNFDKYIEAWYLTKVLDEINVDIYVKRTISKDATASVFQHLIKILGYRNEKSLEICNLLNETTGFDTYEVIIGEFLNRTVSNILSIQDLMKIFNRDSLKKTIMTERYSAGHDTCFNYFKEKIQIEKYNSDETIEIKKIFRLFYNYLSKLTILCEKEFNQLNDYFRDMNYVVYMEDATIDLKYYITEVIQSEIGMEKKRYTKKIKKLTKDINYNMTNRALSANYIHAQDAAFARGLIEKKTMISIHDCFLVDYLSITYVISLANEGMSEVFDLKIKNIKKIEKIYSLFILI